MSLAHIALLLFGLSSAPQQTSRIRLEAEDATLDGPAVVSARSGFSGKGYVTGFTKDKARIVWRKSLRAGIYDLTLGFSTPGGEKGVEVAVNGKKTSAMLPNVGGSFSTLFVGRLELKEGENEIAVERGWGYYDVDYLDLAVAPAPKPPKPVPNKLVNPNASPATKKLFTYLISQYGKKTLAGQYDLSECNYVEKTTGKFPAIEGGDLMDYSPSRIAFGSKPNNLSESFVKSGERGQILALSWHWNAPLGLINKITTDKDGKKLDLSWYRGFYTNATTFDVKAALDDPNNEGYKLIIRDIDAIAVELKKLSAKDIPVLWRPLHEADGAWFWWGAQGPKPCLALWRLMYDRMTNVHKLNNLIWVWNSPKLDWYPGDDVVDIMTVDAYPEDRTDPLTGSWDALLKRFDGKKMLGIAEFPSMGDTDRMFRFGCPWLFTVSWTGGLGPKSTAPETLKKLYTAPNVVTLDDLPWRK